MREGGEALLRWYARRRSAYPWRVRSDPYRVLVSEVMLQQTGAARAAPAFERFVGLFPTVESLAAAPVGGVLGAWAGLGYNRRALALARAARAIAAAGGRVPASPEELRSLPGVGPYTAAAVASLAYGVPVAAVDVNAGRVVSRALLGADEGEAPPARVREAAASWLDQAAPGEWNQALMDLGREVCRPRPRCAACPLSAWCRFRSAGLTAAPRRRRQGPFEGSFRQVRGRVVAVLRERRLASLCVIAREAGEPLERVARAAAALAAEGIVRAGPAALAGRPGGRVWLER